jgi:GT2 family glycosyltransferase
MDQPETINTVGNPVHYLGLSWAGGLGEPASAHAVPADVASATGAAMACRRDTWESLGGFYEPLFLYQEDTELSLRCWQQGLAVRFEPGAVVDHDYEFARNPGKWELLERNRLFFMFTLWERRTLAVVLPALLGMELAMFAVSVAQGWWRAKLRGWWWLWRHRSLVRTRRAQVAAARRVPDRELLHLLTGRFDPGAESGVSAPAAVQTVSAAYWWLARRALRVRLDQTSST